MDIKPKDDRERLITGVEAEEETVFNICLLYTSPSPRDS